MKKITILLAGLAMSVLSMAQDSIKVKNGIMHGRTIYAYGGGSATMPTTTYGYSLEAGLWGTSKPTSFAVTTDLMKTLPNTSSLTTWVGVKAYLTVLEYKTSWYYVYAAPKVSIISKDNKMSQGLLEIGFNPCYSINNHMLMSVTLCDQIINVNNKFDKSIWNPGFSVGLLFYK